jgi:hypothetical protein
MKGSATELGVGALSDDAPKVLLALASAESADGIARRVALDQLAQALRA